MNRKQLNLILALIDAPIPQIARRMIKRVLGTSGESLIERGFLLSSGCNRYLARGGEFIPVFEDSEPGKVKYLAQHGQWIKISTKEVEKMHLNTALFFDWIMREFRVNGCYRVEPMIDDVLWSLGEFRLGKHFIVLLFARRVVDVKNTKMFIDALRKQPQKPTLVLVPDDIELYLELPRHMTLLPFSQLLNRRNDNAMVDFDVLEAIFHKQFLNDNQTGGTLFRHTQDCRVIVWGGVRYELAKRQAIVVETLLNAGGRVHKDDIQNELKVPEKIHRIMRNKVNGEWQTSPLWNTLIRSDRKGYYFLDFNTSNN